VGIIAEGPAEAGLFLVPGGAQGTGSSTKLMSEQRGNGGGVHQVSSTNDSEGVGPVSRYPRRRLGLAQDMLSTSPRKFAAIQPLVKQTFIKPTLAICKFSTVWVFAGPGMSTHVVILFLAITLILGACSPPPAARPRDGAPVGTVGKTTRIDLGSIAPPTLVPATALGANPAPSGPEPSTPRPTMTPNHVIASTGVGAVNMRAGPSMSAPVIRTLREGTLVEAVGDPVSAEGRSWQQIRSNDHDGWVVAGVVRPR
jgi:hypothetical protein